MRIGIAPTVMLLAVRRVAARNIDVEGGRSRGALADVLDGRWSPTCCSTPRGPAFA
jgi:hypothetical protein